MGKPPSKKDQLIQEFLNDLVRIPTYAERKGITAEGVWRVINNKSDARIRKADLLYIDQIPYLVWSKYKDVPFAKQVKTNR